MSSTFALNCNLRASGQGVADFARTASQLAQSRREADVLWTLPGAGGWWVVLLTPLGQNVGVLGEGRVFGLRDCLLAPLAEPGEPGGSLVLLQVLAQAFDLGGREAWLFFMDAAGARSSATRLVLAEDAGVFFLPGP